MLVTTCFLVFVFWTRFLNCEGTTCYMSSCSYHDETKWYLHRKTVANCKQVLPGGYQSACPNHDTVLLFDEPFLSDLDDPKTTLSTSAGSSSSTVVAQRSSSVSTPQAFSTTAGFSSSTVLTQRTSSVSTSQAFSTSADSSSSTVMQRTSSDSTSQASSTFIGSSSLTVLTQSTSSVSTPQGYNEQNDTIRCDCNEGASGDCQTCSPSLPTDCYEIFQSGSTVSGIYTIKPSIWMGSPFKVYCTMGNDGGWTVLQRRVNGSVDFYRDWEAYEQGFGFLDHEFWLGNDKIFSLTNQLDNELRIDLVNSLGSFYYASYDLFRIANEANLYKMTDIGTFTGTTGFEAMTYHKGNNFSTFDRDNEKHASNCAERYHGAWWYRGCRQCNLNGDYFGTGDKSITWLDLPGNEFNIQYTEIKIRRVRSNDDGIQIGK